MALLLLCLCGDGCGKEAAEAAEEAEEAEVVVVKHKKPLLKQVKKALFGSEAGQADAAATAILRDLTGTEDLDLRVLRKLVTQCHGKPALIVDPTQIM